MCEAEDLKKANLLVVTVFLYYVIALDFRLEGECFEISQHVGHLLGSLHNIREEEYPTSIVLPNALHKSYAVSTCNHLRC